MNDQDIIKKRLSIGEASEYLGVSIDTLRRWEKKGRIDPLRSPGGHRYYTQTDLDNLFNKKYTRDEPTFRMKIKTPKTTPAPRQVNTYISPYQQFSHDVPPPPPPVAQPHTIPQQTSQASEKLHVETVPIPPKKTPQTTTQKPVEKIVVSEKQPPMPQIKPDSKLTERQTELLHGILKTERKKKPTRQRIIKYIAVAIVILAVINIAVLIYWQATSDIISPIP